jgi:DNA-directed RNA polymerase subunit RPC12/RpoP
VRNVPPEGTLRRCPHSVYIPPDHAIAEYCLLCNPVPVPLGNKGPLLSPGQRHPAALKEHDRLHANKHAEGGACPRCGSQLRYANADGSVECADCSNRWTPKRQTKAQRRAIVSIRRMMHHG